MDKTGKLAMAALAIALMAISISTAYSAIGITPSNIQANNSPSSGQVPSYLSDNSFTWITPSVGGGGGLTIVTPDNLDNSNSPSNGNLLVYDNPENLNNLLFENNSEVSTGSTGYVMVKSWTSTASGTLQIAFDLYVDPDSSGAAGKIYKNGFSIGTEYLYEFSGDYENFTENISGWSIGDNVELWMYSIDGEYYPVYNQNFAIYGGPSNIIKFRWADNSDVSTKTQVFDNNSDWAGVYLPAGNSLCVDVYFTLTKQYACQIAVSGSSEYNASYNPLDIPWGTFSLYLDNYGIGGIVNYCAATYSYNSDDGRFYGSIAMSKGIVLEAGTHYARLMLYHPSYDIVLDFSDISVLAVPT